MSYLESCIENYGAVKYQMYLDKDNSVLVKIWLDRIDDAVCIKCANKSIEEVKAYFERNKYTVSLLYRDEERIELKVKKNVKNWSRIGKNIDNILRHYARSFSGGYLVLACDSLGEIL